MTGSRVRRSLMHGVYSEWAVTLPSEWLVWLATCAARLAVYRLQGWHGPLRLLHVLATAVLFGGIVVLDLRLMGVLGREIAVDALSRLVLPVVHLAFAVLVGSGAWLFLYDPIQTGSHSYFVPKLLLIAVAVGNALVFSRPPGFGRRALGAASLRHARIAGVVSLVAWAAVIACATGNQVERPALRGRGATPAGITHTADDFR